MHRPQLPQRQPVQLRTPTRRNGLVHARIGLLADGDDRHVMSEATRRVQRKKRESAVAGDQTDAHGGLLVVRR